MECFAKRIMTECRCTTKKFSGQGRFPGTRTFHQKKKKKKKKTRKEVPTGKYFGFFSLKTTFWMENLIQRWTQSGLFSPKNQDTLHQPSCATMSAAEYSSVFLNILENAWINCSMPELWMRLIILHVWQAFEDAPGSKCAMVLNVARLYMQGSHKVLNVSIWLNTPQWSLNTYAWMP